MFRIGVSDMRSYFTVSVVSRIAFLGSIPRGHRKSSDQPLVIGLAVSRVPTCLEIFDQAHETFILMVLMVAMEQRRARVISHEVDFRRRESDHVQRVFHQPRCRFVADLGYLEGMPVQVDGVCVAAVVVHDESVAFASFDREQRVCVRP